MINFTKTFYLYKQVRICFSYKNYIRKKPLQTTGNMVGIYKYK